MLQVDYIDNFETKALDTIRDLAMESERIDIAVAFLSHSGWGHEPQKLDSPLNQFLKV